MKKIIKIISLVLMFVLVFILVSIVHLYTIRVSDLNKQEKYLNKIKESYVNYTPIGYDQFVETDISNKPLNEVRFLASHNSYKKRGSFVGRLFVGLGDSFKEARALKYSYKTITEQLNNGIFSFELDLRLRGEAFEVTHVPLVDNSSNIVNFKMALEEINLFIENEPNTFPIIIMLEIKDDYMFLDPKLKAINNNELNQLDELITNTLGDKVFRPSEFIETEINLKERVDKGWPTISELNNKVLFVVHAGKYSQMYNQAKNISNQVLFTSSYYDNILPNSVFIIHNDINITRIQDLVNNNYIVRTRIGDTLSYTETEFNNALISNAQILTTDYSVARSDLKEFLYLDNKKHTIITAN